MNYMDESKSPLDIDGRFVTPNTKAGRKMIKRFLRGTDVRGRMIHSPISVPRIFINRNGELQMWAFVRISGGYNLPYEGYEDCIVGKLRTDYKAVIKNPFYGFMGDMQETSSVRYHTAYSRSGIQQAWHWSCGEKGADACREEQRRHYEEHKRLEELERRKEMVRRRRRKALRKAREAERVRPFATRSSVSKKRQLAALGILA